MWYVMVFADMHKTQCVKVMEFATIKTAATVLAVSPRLDQLSSCVGCSYYETLREAV